MPALPMPGPAARTALLLHTLPDGRWHYDWLIEPPSPPLLAPAPSPGPLLAFRTWHRLDLDPHARGSALPIHAERLPDHREVYLTYQGPISNRRGTVQRLAAGLATWHHVTDSDFRLTLGWPSVPASVLQGKRTQSFTPDGHPIWQLRQN